MSDPLKRVKEYVGKVDRRRIAVDRSNALDRAYRQEVLHLETPMLRTADTHLNEVSQKTRLEVAEAISWRDTLNMDRHDLWVEFIQNNRRDELVGPPFGDVKVSDFVKEVLGYNGEFSNEAGKISPDILARIKDTPVIIMADVAVSRTAVSVRKIKQRKYDIVKTEIEKLGFQVDYINAVFEDDGSDATAVYSHLCEVRMCYENRTMIGEIITMMICLTEIIQELPSRCVNPMAYKLEIEKKDIVESLYIPPLNFEVETSPMEPVYEEDQLIEWVKEEAERMVDSGYFDRNTADAKAAFEYVDEEQSKMKHAPPKACLPLVHNSKDVEDNTDLALVSDYINDLLRSHDNIDLARYILDILPSTAQLKVMKNFQMTDLEFKVYGKYNYTRTRSSNMYIRDMDAKLQRGKKLQNKKEEPAVIDPIIYPDCISIIDKMIENYGSLSDKPSFLKDEWDTKTNFEEECSSDTRKAYDYVRRTNGAQIANALSMLFTRIVHTKASLSKKDAIFVPPNASFIAFIPREHAPTTARKCDIPLIFITRKKKGDSAEHLEFQYKVEGLMYTYYVSKLCRLSVDKMANWEQAGHKLVMTASYLLSRNMSMWHKRNGLIGALTLLILDTHQKLSEVLDLFKYTCYMPFAELSRLSVLIKDKMNVLIKTRLDVWMSFKMREFIRELSDIEKLNAKKPQVKKHRSRMTTDCLGLSMNLPSFLLGLERYKTVEDFVEETTMMMIVRPKALYGGQGLDAAVTDLARWAKEEEEEKGKFGGWITNGIGNGKFPFNSKFAFSSDAIVYALRNYEEEVAITPKEVRSKLKNVKYGIYMHENASLRGCVKDDHLQRNPQDWHTTSLDACLTRYQEVGYDEDRCTALGMAKEMLESNKEPKYAVSQKEQRGGHRTISTPDLGSKAMMMAIEKPEQAVGHFMPNNIIVDGKVKVKEQSECYRSLVSEACKDFKFVSQVSEDQSKFSENDNLMKYIPYIRNNKWTTSDVKQYQVAGINKMSKRLHLIHRMPKEIINNASLHPWLVMESSALRIRNSWPQGMLNFISTNVHCIADRYITYAYNKAYPNRKVMVKGLVHSDDSWITVAYNDFEDYVLFVCFRIAMKRMFCLKCNDKKIWGSKYLGELVSNYNINGSVHLSVSKVIANSFCNLMYQNWTMDVQNQISSLQQALRQGATLPTIILLKTILRQQIISAYAVKGKQEEYLYLLPVELGGFPDMSAYELAVGGVSAHYTMLSNCMSLYPDTAPSILVRKALALSAMRNSGKMEDAHRLTKGRFKPVEEVDDESFATVQVANRGDVFTCIKHLLPKSRKISETVKKLNAIPFEGSGIEMIVTRPKDLKTALGDLKARTSTMLFQLASEQYSQSYRRLACSQAMQATGKVVRLMGSDPMTISEMIEEIEECDIEPSSTESLKIAFDDCSDVPSILHDVVNKAQIEPSGRDKRKVLNKPPSENDRYHTLTNFNAVLLYIIDEEEGTTLRVDNFSKSDDLDLIKRDANMIMDRFKPYFLVYNTRYACNLIKTQQLGAEKARLYIQPKLENDSSVHFYSDLYGKVVDNVTNYLIRIDLSSNPVNCEQAEAIETLYTLMVLNIMYPGLYEAIKIDNMPISRYLNTKIHQADISGDLLLKYALLLEFYCNDLSMIRSYDKSREYHESYIVAQRFDRRLGWTGDLVTIGRCGPTVIKIVNRSNEKRIESNTTNAYNVMFCMKQHVEKNFKSRRYEYACQWSSSVYWKPFMTKEKVLKLISATANVSTIRETGAYEGIPFKENKDLKAEFGASKRDSRVYEIDQYRRKVTYKENGRSYTLGSAIQNMKLPAIRRVLTKFAIHDHLNTRALLENNVINKLVADRLEEVTRADIYNVVKTSQRQVTDKVIVTMILAMVECFNKSTGFDFEPDVQVETHVYDITEGMTPQAAWDVIKYVEPEDLSAVEEEFTDMVIERSGRTYKYDNIWRLMMKLLGSGSNPILAKEGLWLLLTDNRFLEEFAKLFTKDKDTGKLVNVDGLIEVAGDLDLTVDPMIIHFIIANNLDSVDGMKEHNLNTLRFVKNMTVTDNRAHIFKEGVKKVLIDILSGDDDEEDPLSRALREN